ncbi:MarR family winged helix-turn-helix transcriptional regulator [Curtobacterium ammoniigenes]|uniref:MarR family winged helix-turn-helix transcriptional regulator n=1 Tax=Curtobacterium ammoniigenes TaxID=395387 RepID=UPI000830F471|nr:MarR family transcriptional regulator [Curtobacterium ammoniigenes]
MESKHGAAIERLLVAANRLIRVAVQAGGNATTSAAWRTLSILESDGALRVGELALASRVAQPTMTRLIAGMVEDGLVARSTDASDSRSQRITITEHGRQRLVALRASLAATVVPMFAELDESEWNTLEAASHILGARLGTEQSS